MKEWICGVITYFAYEWITRFSLKSKNDQQFREIHDSLIACFGKIVADIDTEVWRDEIEIIFTDGTKLVFETRPEGYARLKWRLINRDLRKELNHETLQVH